MRKEVLDGKGLDCGQSRSERICQRKIHPESCRQIERRGNEVTLFLIKNGVISARKGAEIGKALTDLSKRGAKVLVDDISLKARGIERLADGISASNVDQLADPIVEGSDKVIWY